jgi:chromosomal replication initiation ATPase DnaA
MEKALHSIREQVNSLGEDTFFKMKAVDEHFENLKVAMNESAKEVLDQVEMDTVKAAERIEKEIVKVDTKVNFYCKEWTSSVDKLKEKYSTIDVLIIDDVQFLANKTQTQEMLYNIFNIMYESGRQIILSGDRSPRELAELEPRLKSRFEWGIIVDIGVPDFETRLAILQEKSRNREFIISQEVSEYIAYNAHSNVRELEGILNQIIAEYELHETPPTLENVSARMNRL